MTAIDDFIANLRQYRGSADSAPMVGDIDLFIAALQAIQTTVGNTMQLASARSTSPLTSGTLWTYTGGIRVITIYGIVRTAIQVQATQTKLSIQNDALAADDMCINQNLTGATVGTLLHVPQSPGTALAQHPNGTDINSNTLVVPIGAVCTNSGKITVTYGAASTGVIDWYLLWEPITPGATVT